MSAAAGLSAARRRRAGSNNTNISNSRNTNRNTVVKQPTRRTIHPMQILEQHERRLRDIESNISKSDIAMIEMEKKNETAEDSELVNSLKEK